MVDVAADSGWLATTLSAMHLMEMIMQGLWFTDSTLLALPYVTKELLPWFRDNVYLNCCYCFTYLSSKFCACRNYLTLKQRN